MWFKIRTPFERLWQLYVWCVGCVAIATHAAAKIQITRACPRAHTLRLLGVCWHIRYAVQDTHAVWKDLATSCVMCRVCGDSHARSGKNSNNACVRKCTLPTLACYAHRLRLLFLNVGMVTQLSAANRTHGLYRRSKYCCCNIRNNANYQHTDQS